MGVVLALAAAMMLLREVSSGVAYLVRAIFREMSSNACCKAAFAEPRPLPVHHQMWMRPCAALMKHCICMICFALQIKKIKAGWSATHEAVNTRNRSRMRC